MNSGSKTPQNSSDACKPKGRPRRQRLASSRSPQIGGGGSEGAGEGVRCTSPGVNRGEFDKPQKNVEMGIFGQTF